MKAFNHINLKIAVCLGFMFFVSVVVSSDEKNVQALWNDVKTVEPNICKRIGWYVTGTVSDTLTPEQNIVWYSECKPIIVQSCGTLKPQDINDLAIPWNARGKNRDILSKIIKLAQNKCSAPLITEAEFDAINTIPYRIRKKLKCPESVNVQPTAPTISAVKAGMVAGTKGFVGGGLMGLCTALVVNNTYAPSAQQQKSNMLIGGLGMGVGWGLWKGSYAALHAYERSKLKQVTTRSFTSNTKRAS